MSHITLTIEDNSREKTYAFVRNNLGEGFWVTRSGDGQHKPNMLTCIELGSLLTKAAKEKGLNEQYNFARTQPKPEKPAKRERVKREKGSRKGRKTTPGMIGGFNPFA